MNWFTRESLDKASDKYKREMIEADGSCKHARHDLAKAEMMRAENDSFGRVSTYVCCKECDAKAQAAEDNRTVVCHDCSSDVRSGDTYQYRWYGFYAPQGDRALTICKACREMPKHKARLESDRREAALDADDADDAVDLLIDEIEEERGQSDLY